MSQPGYGPILSPRESYPRSTKVSLSTYALSNSQPRALELGWIQTTASLFTSLSLGSIITNGILKMFLQVKIKGHTHLSIQKAFNVCLTQLSLDHGNNRHLSFN